MDGNIWRLTNSEGFQDYPSCRKLNLGSGILISRDIPDPVLYADHIQFLNYCYLFRPVYMAAKYVGVPGTYLPMFRKDWDTFSSIKNKVGRDFHSGIYPFLMSYSANFVLTIFLTFLSFLIIRPRPYLFASTIFKAGCLFCSINLIIALSQMFVLLRDQHVELGVTITTRVIALLSHSATFISLHFISILTLQLSQVFIIMRTFERNREKRIVFLCGIVLTITTSVLWVAPQLGTVVRQKKVNWDILPVFVYLFRIVIETLYACFIISYTIRKRKLWSKSIQMLFLTFLTILSVLLLPGFFLADVANAWIAQFGELFTDVCYIGATFLPWEWLERLTALQRTERAQSVLGRPIYDNEQQDFAFAKYTLKVQDALQRTDDTSYSHSGSNTNHRQTTVSTSNQNTRHDSQTETFELRELSNTPSSSHVNTGKVLVSGSGGVLRSGTEDRESINEINFNPQERRSDIIKGSDSVNSSSNNGTSKSSNKKKQQMVKKRIGLERPPETFVYNTKDVVFDSESDESDDHSDENSGNFTGNENVSEVNVEYDLENNYHDDNMYYDEDFERDFGKYTNPTKQ